MAAPDSLALAEERGKVVMTELSPEWGSRRVRVADAVHRALQQGNAASAISALAMLMALSAAPVQAQNAANSTSSDLEEVVVTGIRQQLQSAQARKADAEEILDSVTAEDIGALPDRSVTEVLQRIPGVTIGRVPDSRDADRIAVEGSGVNIRGLSWVRSELNGRSAFSAKKSRVLGFEDIPPELMSAIDVYKNPSASMIEGGLAGVVDLRTRMPFDSPGQTIGASAEYTVGDLRDKAKPSASLLYSNRWDTGIGEMGLLLSTTYSELSTQSDTYHIDKYYARTNLPGYEGQTVYAPGGIGWRKLDVDRERTGGSLGFQWRPSDTVDVSLQYFHSNAKFEQDENAVWTEQGNSLTGTNLQVRNGYLVGGHIDNGGFGGSARFNERESKNDDGGLHVTWRPAEQWRFDVDVQRSLASTDAIDLTMGSPIADIGEKHVPADAIDFDLRLNGSSTPTIRINPNSVMTDPNWHVYGWAMDHYEDNDADAWAYRADGEFTFDNNDWLDRIRFGVRHENYDSTTRETGYRWGAVSLPWGNGPNTFAGSRGQYMQQNYSEWFHGGTAPGSYLFPNTRAFRDRLSFNNAVQAVQTETGGWVPWDGDYSATKPAADGLGVNVQNQKTLAGYVAANFEHGKLDGNLGVRVVSTDNEGTGFLTFLHANVIDQPNETAFANGAGYLSTDKNSYTDVLPSLNLRYKLREDLFFRAAVARSVARPDFSLLASGISVTAQLGLLQGDGTCGELPANAVVGTCVFQYNGFSGNPDLEPMRSWQYDLTAEWYMTPTNSLTGGIFYKAVEGFLETSLNSAVDYTNNGQTRTVRVLRPENQGNGYVQGLEVAYNGFFDFLPGFWKNFGSRVSFTYVESGGARNIAGNPYDQNQRDNSRVNDYPLEGLSKTSYNAELYYSTDLFEARLAYNWREKYVLTMAAANLNIPAWADDYGELNASLSFNVAQNVKVGVQAVNLSDSTYRVLVDNIVDNTGLTYHNWVSYDRRYSMFVRASF